MYKTMAFYEDDDFSADLEYAGGDLYLHCTTKNFSPKVFKKIKHQFFEILKLAYIEGFEEVYCYTKNTKFANLLSPTEFVAKVNYEGETYEVLKWDLR